MSATAQGFFASLINQGLPCESRSLGPWFQLEINDALLPTQHYSACSLHQTPLATLK